MFSEEKKKGEQVCFWKGEYNKIQEKPIDYAKKNARYITTFK